MSIDKEFLIEALEVGINTKGLSIELATDFKEDYIDLDEEVKKDNARVYIKGSYMNRHMFLYTFAKMLKNNEITISFNENASEKHIAYLEKLSKEK